MIYTSYYAHYKGDKGVAISLWLPKWYPTKIEHFPALAPTQQILQKWKNSDKTDADKQEYVEAYINDVLAKLDVHTVAKQLDGKVLLCYERATDFCHRHIVRQWLNQNGYKCEELN